MKGEKVAKNTYKDIPGADGTSLVRGPKQWNNIRWATPLFRTSWKIRCIWRVRIEAEHEYLYGNVVLIVMIPVLWEQDGEFLQQSDSEV